MTTIRFTILLLSMILAACSSHQVKVLKEAGDQLKQVKSYSWKSGSINSEGKINNRAVVFDTALRSEVKRILSKKGLTLTDSDGDVVLDYRVTIKPELLASGDVVEDSAIWQRNNFGVVQFEGWVSSNGAAELNSRGIILLTVYDQSGKSILWEAYVSKILHNQPGFDDDTIKHAVEAAIDVLLRRFPKI